jgi:uncharacterized protein YbjT (DUF2867 family)
MARILIVGCGCRGRALAAALIGDGHAVRGTTRDPARAADIEAAGVEARIADPDRLGTLLAHLEGVSALCWLMGTATGAAGGLHGERLEALLAKLVDTPVRGVVYEAAGALPPECYAGGRAILERASRTWGMPVAAVDRSPADVEHWVAAMRKAVASVLA